MEGYMDTHRFDGCLASVLLEVIVAHDLTANKLILKVRAKCYHERNIRQQVLRCTNWMTPAAWGALVPRRIVHARTSSGPQVKYRIN